MLGSFGTLVQTALGVVAFMVLFIKRCLEKPPRPWKIWFLDVSKQIFSACVGHGMNLLLSIIMSTESHDECVYYLVNTILDCSVGVFISFFFMKLITFVSKKCGCKVRIK